MEVLQRRACRVLGQSRTTQRYQSGQPTADRCSLLLALGEWLRRKLQWKTS